MLLRGGFLFSSQKSFFLAHVVPLCNLVRNQMSKKSGYHGEGFSTSALAKKNQLVQRLQEAKYQLRKIIKKTTPKNSEEIQLLSSIETAQKMINEEADKSAQELNECVEIFEEEAARIEKSVKEMLFQHYAHPCFIQVITGVGGLDAADFAEMLLNMYMNWAKQHSYPLQLVHKSPHEGGGIRNGTVMIGGDSFAKLYYEAGIHRLVRISPFDSNSRRHTSFASVIVLPKKEGNENHDENHVEVKESEIRIDTMRSSGAGGQHVNTTDSAVRITHIPTGEVVVCSAQRSQHKNKQVAMEVLMARLRKRKEEEHQREHDQFYSQISQQQWGSQIRSYVLHPIPRVTDARTGIERYDAENILEGDIDEFLNPLP